jgi:hypothetical protein
VAGNNGRPGPVRDLPHDAMAERSVIGSMLVDPECVPSLLGTLRPRDFFVPQHAVLFMTIDRTLRARGTVDSLSVVDELRATDRLLDAGGEGLVAELASEIVTTATVDLHAKIVREQARRREMIEAAREVVIEATGNVPLGDIQHRLRLMVDEPVDEMGELVARLRTPEQLAADPPVAWLVDGFVPAGGLTVLAGDPGSGKTLVALDIALRAARGGESWLGRRLRPHSTLYLTGEGHGGLGVRLRAWTAAHDRLKGAGGRFLAFCDHIPDLTAPGALGRMLALVDGAGRQQGSRVDVVIVDTLAMATPGADENDAGAMGASLRVLAELRTKTGVAVVVLHHMRKAPAGTPQRADAHALRGSSALHGAADVVLLALTRDKEREIRPVKVRDGECLQHGLHYTITGQDTGWATDEGRPEFGPVVVPAAEDAGESDDALRAELTRAEEACRDALRKTLGKLGGLARSRNHLVNSTPGKRAVMLDVIKGMILDRELVEAENGLKWCPQPVPVPGSPPYGGGDTGEPVNRGGSGNQPGTSGNRFPDEDGP